MTAEDEEDGEEKKKRGGEKRRNMEWEITQSLKSRNNGMEDMDEIHTQIKKYSNNERKGKSK